MKNKVSLATLKKCDFPILTISSPPQSRETIPLRVQIIIDFVLNKEKTI